MFNSLRQWIHLYRSWRVGGAQAVKRFWREKGRSHLRVLSSDPPVIYLWWERNDERLHAELYELRLLLLYLFPWHMEASELPGVAESVRARLRKYPLHRIAFLCNEAVDVEVLTSLGVEAHFINQNALVNEAVFDIIPAIKKTHDAVYSAAIAPYKRHQLASEVKSIALVAYTYSGTAAVEYEAEVRRLFKHAWWAKDTKDSGPRISARRMAELYNHAHVGLCLSAVEGAMFASMEYMLCGLPIVTTRSKGGRDVFWDARYVIECDDTADAVASAVQEMKARNISPTMVRAETLRKIETHRERLRGLLESVGVRCEIPWPPGSGHAVTGFLELKAVARAIRSGAEPSAICPSGSE